MNTIKYQDDGSEKIYTALFENNQNRYLLADEVGLGKTITAASVISKLYCKRNNNVRIGYICANKALARENVGKLKEKIVSLDKSIIINETETQTLSLYFLKEQKTSASKKSVSIHTITPATTITIQSAGTAEERAYAYRLLVGNGKNEELLEKFCKGRFLKNGGYTEVNAYQGIPDLDCEIIKAFNDKWEEKVTQGAIDKLIEEFYKTASGVFIYSNDDEHTYCAQYILKKILESSDKCGITFNAENMIKCELADKKKEAINQEIDNANNDNLFLNKYIIAINNIHSNKKEPYISKVKEIYLQENKRATIRSYLFAIFGNGDDYQGCDRIKSILKQMIGEYNPSTQSNIDDKVKKGIEDAFCKTICRGLVKYARMCMILCSIDALKMDLFLADEIQNYSEIFRKETGEKQSEMGELIRELIQGERKLVMMSATPFRYHTKMNQLINEYQDEAADTDDDGSKETENIEEIEETSSLYDARQQYLEQDTDIYDEFKMIISYLNKDFCFKQWEEYNEEKIYSINNNNKEDYKEKINKQSQMLKKANISRVERYMAGISEPFRTKNECVPVDDIYWKELRHLARTSITCHLDEFDIEIGDKLIFIDGVCYHKDSNYKYWVIDINDISNQLGEDSFDWVDVVDTNRSYVVEDDYYINKDSDESKEIKRLQATIEKNMVLLDYIKSTPAMFSFCTGGYTRLENLKDENGDNTLCSNAIKNYEKIFATVSESDLSSDGSRIMYNARIAALFKQIFEVEGIHKLLFIPPSRGDIEIKGVFEGKRGISKRLFFTDYNMTPKSLATILTYEANRRVVCDLKKKLSNNAGNGQIVYFNETDNDEEKINKDNGTVDYGKLTVFSHDYYWDNGKLAEKLCKKATEDEGNKLYNYFIEVGEKEEAKRACLAYYKYMTKISSLRIILAYTTADDVYSAINEYGENGQIIEVLKEYQEYIKREWKKSNKKEKESYLEALARILSAESSDVYISALGNNTSMKMSTRFAVGHYSGNKGANSNATESLNNKIARFNSPFLPFQFISTSIGQEGFDFHVYCRKIVHWSLEFNPVKFEQREGRINRYQGYALRLNVFDQIKIMNSNYEFENWNNAFSYLKQNDTNNADKIGLFPNFVCEMQDGLGLERECYYYPGSFEEREFLNVLKAVGYYRSLLGQSGSDQFEDQFKKLVKDESSIIEYFINLYPNIDNDCSITKNELKTLENTEFSCQK